VQRAAKVARALRATGKPVTLAVQDFPETHQRQLDDFVDGKLTSDQLFKAMQWPADYPTTPYAKLLDVSAHGIDVVAVGVKSGADAMPGEVEVPAGYDDVLVNAAGTVAPWPPQIDGDIARTMAWADLRIARRAQQAWRGEGYLVIVVDRTRVEGGKGVGWQAEKLQSAPVHEFVLAWGGRPPCYDGDKIWK
jgi:hypothetical protein